MHQNLQQGSSSPVPQGNIERVLHDGKPITHWRICHEIGLFDTLLFLHRDLELYHVTNEFSRRAVKRVEWILNLQGDAYKEARNEAHKALEYASGTEWHCNVIGTVQSIKQAVYLSMNSAITKELGRHCDSVPWAGFWDDTGKAEDERMSDLLWDILRDNRLV